jgi:hypothetical protein
MELTVGKVLLVYEMSIQVLPTAPSPTVTHFMNLDALISAPKRRREEVPQTWFYAFFSFSLSRQPNTSLSPLGQRERERSNSRGVIASHC